MRQPARLENIRTLDPHSHAALTDLAPRLGSTREMHEPGQHLLTVVGGVGTKDRVALEPEASQGLI